MSSGALTRQKTSGDQGVPSKACLAVCTRYVKGTTTVAYILSELYTTRLHQTSTRSTASLQPRSLLPRQMIQSTVYVLTGTRSTIFTLLASVYGFPIIINERVLRDYEKTGWDPIVIKGPYYTRAERESANYEGGTTGMDVSGPIARGVSTSTSTDMKRKRETHQGQPGWSGRASPCRRARCP